MSDGINIVDLISSLPSRPRGRACIILTQDYHDQEEWATELASQVGCDHLNLLKHFESDEELSAKIDEMGVTELLELVKNHSNQEILVVSGIEFLKATWVGDPNASEILSQEVENWRGHPSLALVVQSDSYIANRNFNTRYRQHKFVIDQRETLKLI